MAADDAGTLIAVDWGTSRLRAELLDRHGKPIADAQSDDGIGELSPGEHEAAFERLAGHWPMVPAVMAGMIGSRQGWREAPYADQADTDRDGVGDACDTCPNDPLNDIDSDGVCGDVDSCPEDATPSPTMPTATALVTAATPARTTHPTMPTAMVWAATWTTALPCHLSNRSGVHARASPTSPLALVRHTAGPSAGPTPRPTHESQLCIPTTSRAC